MDVKCVYYCVLLVFVEAGKKMSSKMLRSCVL